MYQLGLRGPIRTMWDIYNDIYNKRVIESI